MNILKVIPYFVPAWSYGGPVQVAYRLAKEMVKRGHEVTVYTTDTFDASKRVEEKEEIIDGIKVRRFTNLSNYLASKHKIFLTPSVLLTAKRELSNFDIIHMHDYRTIQNVIVHHYAKKYSVPYVLQAHGVIPRIAAKQRLKWVYDVAWGYRLLKDASKLLALTELEAEQYQNNGARKNQTEIVPNGIDLSEFESLPKRGEFRKEYGLDGNQKIVLYLGRIHQTKGLDLLIRTFAGLSREIDSARLAIVGPDDGYASELASLAQALEISDKVLFTGPIYERNRLSAYVDADIFVTPSFVGFPVTFVEACACGTPVITTKSNANLGWIDNQAGYVVSYDETQLHDALAKLLTNRDLAQQFGENGKKLVREKFNWSKIAEELERIYLEAKANNQQRGREN